MSIHLLTQIARCEVARKLIEDPLSFSPCKDIVASQRARTWDDFQVPEPWNGFISSAPILYVSSNPSISGEEAYPRGTSDIRDLVDYFDARFEPPRVIHGTRPLLKDGTYGVPVRYWCGILARTSELLGRPARPGRDYALTEVVHCKSEKERGVALALTTCAARYLEQTLRYSGAKLVVIVGKKALALINCLQHAELPTIPHKNGTDVLDAFGRKRVFAYLGHPTGPEPKKFEAYFSRDRVGFLRRFLEA